MRLVLSLLIFVVSFPVEAQSRTASLILETQYAQILFAENEFDPVYPASLTKVMTLYLTFKALRSGRLTLGQLLTVSPYAASQPASNLQLKPNDTLTVHQAIQALIVKSANDVAMVLAEELGRTEARFAQIMTETAKTLYMRQTRFRNASGLHDPAQVSTALDLTLLARAVIIDFPEYYHYFGRTQFKFRNKVYHTYNQLLLDYQGMDGLKTGFIRASGYHLLASVKKRDTRIIAVILGQSSQEIRNRRMANLLDRGFDIQGREHSFAISPEFQAQILSRQKPQAWATRLKTLRDLKRTLLEPIQAQRVQRFIPKNLILSHQERYHERQIP